MIHKAKNGTAITVDSRWALQKDLDGNPLSILEIDRDITERKTAEKKTEESRRYAESIIATIQEALVVLDPELKVIRANDSFYKLFSLKPANTEKQYIYKLNQNQFNIPSLKILLEDILPKNTSFEQFEMEYSMAQGKTKTLLLNARRKYQKTKKTEMILLAIQDITLHKQQEKKIMDFTEELLFSEEKQRQKVAIALHDSIGQMLFPKESYLHD